MTHEPDYYRKLYQAKFRGDKTQNYQKFEVPIGNAKRSKKIQFCTEAPMIQYHQKSYNSYCLSILSSAFHYIGDNRAVYELVNCFE